MIPLRLRRPRHPVHLLRRVAAGLLTVLALVLALRPPATAPAPPSARPPAVVLVGARDLPAGTVLTAEDLLPVQLPTAAVPDGATAAVTDLVGATVAAPLRRGEPVTDVRLVGPALWASVPDGQVAAPVRLADLGVAALLRPGDRVDVLAGRPAAGVEVVARDAVVLAAGGPADGADTTAGLLVLAVPAETAAALAAASADATLTVTLGRP